MRRSLDDIRAERPELGLALYAYDPGGIVTLEVLHGGETFTFTGATESDVINAAFPPAQEAAAPPPSTNSIFD